MFLTKRSRSLGEQPEQAPRTPAERRIRGEKHGMGMDAAASRKLGTGEPREGTARAGSRTGIPRGRDARLGANAQPNPPPGTGSVSFRPRGAHPAPHRPGPGLLTALLLAGPAPRGPAAAPRRRRHGSAPPLRAPPHANRMQMTGGARARRSGERKPGTAHAGKGARRGGKTGPRHARGGARCMQMRPGGREGKPRAVCKRDREGGAIARYMQIGPGGRESCALYANERGGAATRCMQIRPKGRWVGREGNRSTRSMQMRWAVIRGELSSRLYANQVGGNHRGREETANHGDTSRYANEMARRCPAACKLGGRCHPYVNQTCRTDDTGAAPGSMQMSRALCK